ncbi:MAG: 50S ribosomal protein L15 [Phycisphaerales bacterium]|nr:50S ribosomal protein L15 [Phycisphaerales bacterium]
MMIHEITSKVGRYKGRKRIGRGPGSGHGKTSGRGHKGAGSRSGHKRRAYFEGGQMTWARRMPKRGFTNAIFRTEYHVVNLKTLEQRCEDGATVNLETLSKVGIIRDTKKPLKILGEGELTKRLDVTAAKLSKSAMAKITAAGGNVTEVPLKKWTRPAKTVKKAAAAATPEPAVETPASEETAQD